MNANPTTWTSVFASIAGAVSTVSLAQVNQVMTFLVGLATLIFTLIKIYQAVKKDQKDRQLVKAWMQRFQTTSRPAPLDE